MTFTTAFSTPCWRKFNCLCLLLLAYLVNAAAWADTINVKSAAIEAADDTYQISATFDVGFTQTLEDAINRGLSLPFIIEYEITRSRWYWLDETVMKGSSARQISYNALTRQYRLTIGSLYQNFERLEDVKQVLSSIRGIDVAERAQFRKGTTYDVGVRMRLDVSRLPKPFQVNALASREWNLASDWFRFTFTP
ncbi:MAG: DUF4390 domain-containing protein [Burkholderiales bacterium]|nr:DUF4390 domain-containing protein [Burkholderiales bacterium]